MTDLNYALATIQKIYKKAQASGENACVIQLTNDNQGFKREVIDQVKATPLSFLIPTHVSILPVGKRESNQKLFDGLEDVYCNSDELKQIIEKMKQQPVKQNKGFRKL